MKAPVLFLEVNFTPFEVTTTSASLFAAAGRLPWWEIATGILTVPAGVAGLIYTLVLIYKALIEMKNQKKPTANPVNEREDEPKREGSVDNGMNDKPGSPPPKLALPVGKIDIAKYRHFHEELVRLATDAICLRGQEGAVLEKLTSLADTIRRNRFKIVLVSPFQGGKSTIFNTACGGRELSPVGFGLKTSAAVAEAHDIDASQEERAEVEWRTDAEMLLGFLDPLRPYLLEHQGDDVRPPTAEELAAQFRLDNPADRQRLQDALDRAQAKYEEQRNAFPPEHIELLRVGWLTLRHYDTVYLANKETRNVSVTTASSWMRFPEKWGRRPNQDYRAEEVVFLYLKKVQFHVGEDSLRALQAVLVDCPGLHASSWDKAITSDCLKHAEAVIFLLGTEGRGLSETNLADASDFAKNELGANLFLGFNIRGATDTQGHEWMSDALVRMRAVGLEVLPEHASVFNAHLALRARQARMRLEQGRLPEDLAEAFARRARETNPAQALPDTQELAAFLIKREAKQSFEAFTGLDHDGTWTEAQIGRMENASHWQDVLRKAADFIAGRKARIILLDHGGLRLRDGLNEWRSGLVDQERAPELTAESLAGEEGQVKTALDSLELGISTSLSAFAESLQGKKTRTILASELCDRLKSRQNRLKDEMKKTVDRAESPKRALKALAECTQDHLAGRLARWQRDLYQDESDAASETIHKLRRVAANAFSEALEHTRAEGCSSLEGIAFRPDVFFDEAVLCALIDAEAGEIDLDDVYECEELDDRDERLFWEKLLDWLLGFSHWKQQLNATIPKIVEERVDKKAKDIARKYVTELMRNVAKTVLLAVKDDSARFRKEVEDRLKLRRATLLLSLPEKKRQAGVARQVREQVLEPFQERLEEFNRGVEAALRRAE